MERKDQGLAYLLQYEHVAWFDQGVVRILDRRVYPSSIEYVECTTVEDVVQAIHDMVTQSAGPYTVAGMGMALAAWLVRDQSKDRQITYLQKAGQAISQARPTTANRYSVITNGCIQVAMQAMEQNKEPYQAIIQRTVDSLNRRYSTMEKVAEYLVDLIPDHGKVLTQCFGETIVGMMCRVAKKRKKHIEFYNAETRPYLQGARLTSSVCYEMGFPTTVITDNMVGYVLEHEGISLFTSAADTIARDGHIANKIGTKQMAILAKYYHVPYFVTGIPDADKTSGKDIVIEQRDPQQVLCYRGIANTLPGVKAIYPAFDITPPYLIDGIVTDQGVYSAYDLDSYFAKGQNAFY
ncbi:MAG: S-methyl-5-thioribose-1-phosphate isomerase [Erysipelotrichaceae bacterium]|nr:S-methyl-5-thioribose-1-phosphate isomerase [Erysipelotrichaceae bacterium]